MPKTKTVHQKSNVFKQTKKAFGENFTGGFFVFIPLKPAQWRFTLDWDSVTLDWDAHPLDWEGVTLDGDAIFWIGTGSPSIEMPKFPIKDRKLSAKVTKFPV